MDHKSFFQGVRLGLVTAGVVVREHRRGDLSGSHRMLAEIDRLIAEIDEHTKPAAIGPRDMAYHDIYLRQRLMLPGDIGLAEPIAPKDTPV